jgi:hypothetical protein
MDEGYITKADQHLQQQWPKIKDLRNDSADTSNFPAPGLQPSIFLRC